jgi:hypothetical protein
LGLDGDPLKNSVDIKPAGCNKNQLGWTQELSIFFSSLIEIQPTSIDFPTQPYLLLFQSVVKAEEFGEENVRAKPQFASDSLTKISFHFILHLCIS